MWQAKNWENGQRDRNLSFFPLVLAKEFVEYGNNYSVIMGLRFAFSCNSVILVLFCEMVWCNCLADTEILGLCHEEG